MVPLLLFAETVTASFVLAATTPVLASAAVAYVELLVARVNVPAVFALALNDAVLPTYAEPLVALNVITGVAFDILHDFDLLLVTLLPLDH